MCVRQSQSVDSVGTSFPGSRVPCARKLLPVMKGKKALPGRALSLNLIDKSDTGSGSKHCHRTYLPRKMVSLIPSIARSTGHVRTRTDTKSDIIYTSMMPIGQMDRSGHERIQECCPSASHRSPARIQISKGFARWLPGAMWLANQVKAAGMWSEAVLWLWLDVA
jgi:hypothetical protein